MKLLITGATGYIGARLVHHAVKHRHEIVLASRSRPATRKFTWMPYELTSGDSIELPSGTQWVIHLAANAALDSEAESEREVQSAKLLIEAVQKSKAKLVFISSQTARPDAPTIYGRTKWRIEQKMLAAGGWVVRPGLVYGSAEQGLFGLLVTAIRKFPVIPAFLPAPKVQPIHIDDLADGLLKIVERDDNFPGVFCLASPEQVSFSHFMSMISSARVRRCRWRVPIPVILIQIVGSLIGKQLRTRLGFERLNSLFNLPFMKTENDLRRLELSLRSLQSGIHPSGNDRRRQLIHEGQSMLSYVLKRRPSIGLIGRYVRAVENLRCGNSLGLPVWILKQPITLALLDDPGFSLSLRGAEFAWRLDAATALAEASRKGAYQFLGLDRVSGPVISLITISRAVLAEITWRMLRITAAPVLHRYIHGAGSQS